MSTESLEADVAVSENNDATGSDNLDFGAFEVSRLTPAEVPQEETPEPTAEIPEEEESTTEAEAEAPEEESEGEQPEADDTEIDDVLSNLNLDGLNAEQVAEIASKLKEHLHGSKAAERIGELTRKRKEAEETAQRFQAELAQLKENKNPLEKETPAESNPFKDLTTLQELQEQYETLGQTEQWADRVLEENPHADPDDVVAELDGKSYTKREVREYKYNARDSREKFLPARLRDIQAVEQAKQAQAASEAQAHKELPWLGDAESNLRKEYDMLLENEHIKAIGEKVPQVAPVINRMLAHALNSISQAQNPPAKKVAKPKQAPPATLPNTVAKVPERDNERVKKQIGDLASRFSDSHSADDFVNFRTAQIAQRRQ